MIVPVHVNAKTCIFIFFMFMETTKKVVFVVTRYAVRKAKTRPYAVRKLKMMQYAIYTQGGFTLRKGRYTTARKCNNV